VLMSRDHFIMSEAFRLTLVPTFVKNRGKREPPRLSRSSGDACRGQGIGCAQGIGCISFVCDRNLVRTFRRVPETAAYYRA
jgi:hypothetical protein